MNIDKVLEYAKDSTWVAFVIYTLIRILFPPFKEFSYYFAYYFIIVRLTVEFIKWFRSVKADG